MEYEGLSDLNLLYDSFRASMNGSAWKEEPQRFEMDFLSEIVTLSEEIKTREYRTSKGTEFTLHERGKTRHIHGARMRDRVVRHALCDGELGPKLKPYLIHNNGASQKGKGLMFSRNLFERDLHNYWLQHRTNEGYIAFIDLSKFYDNVRHDKVREYVYPKITEEARWLMDEVLKSFEVDVSYMSDEQYASCMNEKFDSVKYYDTIPKCQLTGEKFMPKSVEIGDQVSQDIGVFFPTRIDNYCKIVRGCKRYGRYMDDIYIIHHNLDELKDIVEGIKATAADLGLFINERKTHIAKLSDTYKYLQIKYSLADNGKVIKRINPKSVTRERRRFKAYRNLLDRGEMKCEDIEQAARSWMGSCAKLMSKKQIEHMKTLYYELFGKELTWKQKLSSKTSRKSQQRSTDLATSQSRSRNSRKISA